jgi:hypothetical protein
MHSYDWDCIAAGSGEPKTDEVSASLEDIADDPIEVASSGASCPTKEVRQRPTSRLGTRIGGAVATLSLLSQIDPISFCGSGGGSLYGGAPYYTGKRPKSKKTKAQRKANKVARKNRKRNK